MRILLLKLSALHIPDGFLSITIALIFWLMSVAVLYVALRRTQGEFAERQIPLMGVMAAFIFAAQMINFPVIGGTSGHLLGGTLAGITLGPWGGMLVMAVVVAVQALLFQDGGLLALGANIFNMGVLTVVIGYGVYRASRMRSRGMRLLSSGVAAWLSVLAGAMSTALQLWLSGTSALRMVMPAMLGVHAFIGIGEGLITVAVLVFILRVKPSLLEINGKANQGRGWSVVGLLLALGVLLLAPFASADPDGLEQVAIDLGFIDDRMVASYGILPKYKIPFLGETNLSTIVAGVMGMLITAGFIALVFKALYRPTKS